MQNEAHRSNTTLTNYVPDPQCQGVKTLYVQKCYFSANGGRNEAVLQSIHCSYYSVTNSSCQYLPLVMHDIIGIMTISDDMQHLYGTDIKPIRILISTGIDRNFTDIDAVIKISTCH